MATPAQIDEQIKHEREAIAQGLKRLKENTKRLEEKSYASASIYGIVSIDELLPKVVQRINETNQRIHAGHTGKSFKEIKKYLSGVEPLAAAAIACKITIDKVFSLKDHSNQLTNVCDAIGIGIEQECQMRHYETNAPGLLNVLKENYWHKSTGTAYKIKKIQTLMNRYDVPQWQAWGKGNRVKLGGWLLSCVCDVSQWFQKEIRREGKKTTNYIVPTDQFMAIKDQVMYNAELFCPLAWPMLIEPNDWTTESPGGYLLNEIMRGHDMVRRSESSHIQGEEPIAFLNKIQKVAYTLNPFTVDVAEVLDRKGIAVGKFRPICHHPTPTKPVDITENYEARKQYRRDRTRVSDLQAQEFKRSCRTRMTMEAVARFKDKERWFIPWSFDYRGRVYPIPAFLTPQCTDFGKSLIRFADESFMDDKAEYWIRFHTATTFGLDKATETDRIHWTYENEDLISRIATDPLGNIHEWENVEEPWQFLAACDEFYHCVIKRDRISTGLPVAIDATCSGLQILAALALDKSTAELVNVLPSDKPQDAYKVIAAHSLPNIPERLHPHWDRKCTKRTVMTIPYNAKPFSNRSYIREALKEKGIDIDKEELTQTVKAVRDAMNQVVPGPMSVMKWIEDEVSKALKRGETEIEWETPSGFVVIQKLYKAEMERITLQVLGQCNMRVPTGDGDVVDKARHKAATAPNLIHSLDASLLCLSALRFNNPIALIHDSVLCRATDMSELSKIVREIYMHLFTTHDYLTDFAKAIGAESEPPIIGDLKPESVIESTYFFC